MYITEIHLENWRSYANAKFTFPVPDPARPLVLVGAMNGHGKTSLLLALYFGLFGRHGLRYAEGFQVGGRQLGDTYYRKAVEEFRRRSAPGDEPTAVSVEIAAASEGEPDIRFRLQRVWYFTSTGKLRQDEEEVRAFVNGVPQLVTEPDDAIALIEDHFVPAHVLPAFFFDGEQAQRRIDESGEREMRAAVEILYGTRLLTELQAQLVQYIRSVREKHNARQLTLGESRLTTLRAERDEIEAALTALSVERADVDGSIARDNDRREELHEQLELLGAATRTKLDSIVEREAQASLERQVAETHLRELAQELAAPLALKRLRGAVVRRLQSEQMLEDWETLSSGVETRLDRVMSRAMPDPDPLLDGQLDPKLMIELRARVRAAVRAIHEPPPDGMAEVVVFRHVSGRRRAALLKRIEELSATNEQTAAGVVEAVRTARHSVKLAQRKREAVAGDTDYASRIRAELEGIRTSLDQSLARCGELNAQQTPLAEQLKQKKAEIGRLETSLEKLAPAQQLIEMAERVRDVLSEYGDQLAPLAVRRLEDAVTQHFISMAASRYADCTVRFRDDGQPVLVVDDKSIPLRTMSGFERRTFGIAFSLALAEVSGFRAPLVIDTPLGNADSEHRMSMLKHIVQADLDQVIILTHDEEVVGPYLKAIKDRVGAKLLVKRLGEGAEAESTVLHRRYFKNA